MFTDNGKNLGVSHELLVSHVDTFKISGGCPANQQMLRLPSGVVHALEFPCPAEICTSIALLRMKALGSFC